ncbi:meiotic recombination protein SPO11 isoform X2 [Centruroides vittatus]
MKRFALILHILAKIYHLIQTNTYSTKREIYYQNINLFGSQNTLNTIIDDISCLLKVPRNQLHIMATSKGHVTGNLRFQDGEKNYIDCCNSIGMLIPADIENITNISSNAKFILVIEKDATFQKLLDEKFTVHLGPCIIITGKGFPDINTRKLIHKLWNTLHIPVLALADADPHGVEIVCVYKFGSLSLAHNSDNLAVPCLKWIGIHPTDIDRLHIPEKALLPLTKHDINKANVLLKRIYIQQNPIWEHQIKTILKLNKKAEIQSLCEISDTFLCNVYLPAKIRLGGWI